MLVFHVVCILSSSLVLLINPDLGRVAAFPYSDLCLPRSSLHVALFWVVTSGLGMRLLLLQLCRYTEQWSCSL